MGRRKIRGFQIYAGLIPEREAASPSLLISETRDPAAR